MSRAMEKHIDGRRTRHLAIVRNAIQWSGIASFIEIGSITATFSSEP
jgi:hypothetical protein